MIFLRQKSTSTLKLVRTSTDFSPRNMTRSVIACFARATVAAVYPAEEVIIRLPDLEGM